MAEPGGRGSAGQSGVRPSGVVMAEPIGKSVLARLGGGVGLREAHSLRLVWMNRSALPLVRGVWGLLRMWRSLKVPQAYRQW